MKLYVAGRLSREDGVRSVMDALRTLGHEITYDWTTHGSLQAHPDMWADVSDKELNGVLTASEVVVFQSGGRGTHVELGAALATGKRVHMILDLSEEEMKDRFGYECIFHHHPAVTRYADVATFLRGLEPAGSSGR